MSITESITDKRCENCQHWSKINGPFGECEKRTYDKELKTSSGETIRSLTIYNCYCEDFLRK